MEQKSMFKRILSFVVIFTMLFSSFVILAAPAFAADEVVDSGKYGAGLTIEVSDNDKIVNLSAEEAAEKLTDGDWALDAPAWGGDTSGVVLIQNKNATQADAWGQINLIWNLGDDPEAYNQIRLGLYSSVESMIGYPTEEDVFFSNDGESWVGGYSSDDIGYGETIPNAYATFEEGATAPGTVIGEIKLRNPQTYKYVKIELYFPKSPFTVESGRYTEETAKPRWEFFGLTEIEITSVKTSNVVTDWNAHEYWEGRGGSNGSYAFNNAEDYAASNLVWWKHVSFAPVEGEEGKYTIAGIRNAGENPKLDFPEGGFVWAAWGDAGAGTPGKAALNLFSSMAVGDVYVLTGFDVEGEYVENDATVTKYVDPNAPVNVALGSKYEIVGLAPSGSYPDTDNKELTDGARVNGKYSEPGWVGVILTSTVRAFDVVVTLGDGETVYDIDKIIVNAGAKGTTAGVTEPNFITYYSVDGENWTEFGTYTATDNADVMSVNATMEVATPVETKYIKVNVNRASGGNLMWLGEIEAYGKEAEAEPAFEYPEGYTVVTGETGKWQSDEGDFDFGYKYEVVGDNLVVDVIINDELVKAAADASTGNGVATNVRLWVNYGNAKWDRLYDGYFKGDEIALFSKDAAGTTGTEGTIAFADNVITFTLPLEELAGGNEQFQFTICVSNTDAAGKNNACLYAFCDTFAWSAWDAENAHTVVLPKEEYFWKEGEYELDGSGNWNPYFAWGYVFEIDSVNSTSGACTAIFDNATDYAANGPGKWTTQLVLAPVAGEEGVYELIKAYKTTGKNAQGNLDAGNVDFEDGKIVLSVQDSGTRPEKDAEGNLLFPNWEDRAASWGLMNTIRARLTLDGNTLTVQDKPADPVISGWGAGVEVMTDGYNGLGEITGYEGNNDKIYGFSNDVLFKAEYSFDVTVGYSAFDAITLYTLDYANGGVMLPEAVKFVVNGTSYDAVITPNENGIATIKAELGETVKASTVTVEVTMGASPYAFAIFNMFTELEVNEIEVTTSKVVTDFNPVSYKQSFGGATGAFIYDDADIYASAGIDWWIHVMLVPSEKFENVYEVVATRAPQTGNYITFVDGAIVWAAWSSAGDTPDSAGAYALAFMGNLSVGDLVKFTGVDFANHTTAADATAETFVDPDAPVNVALGKEYEISGIGNRDSYYGSITDGSAVMHLNGDNHKNWFGFYNNGNAPTNAPDKVGYFIIDLEKVYDVESIRVGLIQQTDWGIAGPAGVKAYGSIDGEEFTEIGTFEFSLTNGTGVWTEIAAEAEAQYIKIEVTLAGTFAFVNEVEVYGKEAGPEVGTEENPGVIEILPGMRGYMGEGLASLTGGAEYYWTTTVPVDGNLNVQFYVIDAEYNGYSVDYSLNGGELLNNYNFDNPGLDDLKAGDVVTIYVKVAADAPAVDVTAMVSLDAVGSMSNPEEITETGDITTEIAEGNFSGHSYEFVAPADGKVTVTMSEDNTGWFYAVSVVESGIYGDNHYSDDDPIVATETVEVKEGDVVTISVSTYGGMSTEGTVKWTLAFEEVKPEVIELLVSHVNAYNWGTFEAMIISGDGKTVEEVIGQKPHWWIVYTVENIDGKYVATDYLKNSEECYKVKVPTGGFLFYVFDTNSAYAAADEGALLGYTFVLGTISLEGVTAIDTSVNAAKVLTVYAPGVEIPEPIPTSKVVNAFNVGHYSEGSEGANGAYIFTDAEKYGDGSGYAWWRHVALAPVEGEEGKYEVTAITKGEGGESGGLEIPEGGFIWVAFEWPEGETSGTYALNVMNSLSVGDFVVFNGIDIENCTTTEDATAEKWVDPDAPVNVALNKEYEISGIGNRDSYYGNVTDGIAVMNLGSNKNAEWFGFYHNGNYPTNAPDKVGYFIIDLEKVYDVESIRVGLIKNDSWGIGAPASVKAYGSLDGEEFAEIGTFAYDLTDGVGVWTEIAAEAQAQYIKIEVTLGGTFAFVNEVEVYGKEAEGGPVDEGITVVPNYNFKYAAGNTTILVPWTMGDTLESILDKQYEWFNFAILEWDADAAVYKVVDVKIGTDIKASVDPENGVDFGVLEIPEYGFILGAHNDDTANHEAIAKLEVGDIVYIYGTDLINATIETALTDAVVTTKALDDKTAFAPEIKPEEPVISVWGNGGTIDVLTDGYNGVGEVTKWEGNEAKLYGLSNNLLVKAEYDFTVALNAKNINAITLYALDYANGGVMLPESVKFVVNGKSYDAVITPNENGIATIKAELGEVISATEIKVEVVMGASPYTFGIFNMFTEIEVTEAKANITQWAAGADIDVLTDGYNGLGEITGYEGNGDKLYGFGNDVLFAAPYSFTVTIDEATINAITLYALDYAGGGVMLPDSVKFVVNGKSYDAVITPNENGIATIKAELGENVTVTEITVEAVMGDSPYTFGIFNMFTELEVTEAVVDPTVDIGDVNGNGEIEMYDYILVKRQIMNTIELTDEQKAVADVNGNGEIEMYDYILIKRHIMGTYVIGE